MDRNPTKTVPNSTPKTSPRSTTNNRDRLILSLTRFVKDRDRAEDIASQAFEAAWEKRGWFRGDAQPYTWLTAIAQNQARGALRRDRTAPFRSLDEDATGEVAAPEFVAADAERREEQVRLARALERLPARHRRVLTAHFVDGLPVREIARRDGVAIGTVLSHIFTAKQLLRRAWDAPPVGLQSDGNAREASSASPEAKQTSPEPRGGARERSAVEPPARVTWDR